MEKTKEMTLKQRLQNLSEEQTPFFHSLTPFAAGFTQGFNYEKKRLVAALVYILKLCNILKIIAFFLCISRKNSYLCTL